MKIGKVKSKYLIIEISSFLTLDQAKNKLWNYSSESRKLLVRNFEILRRQSEYLEGYSIPCV